MELYAAIDLHSNNSVLVVTDAEDHVVCAKRLRNDLEMIVSALRSCPGDVRAERGTGWSTECGPRDLMYAWSTRRRSSSTTV